MGRHPGHRDLRRPIALPRPSTCLPGEGGLFRVKAGAASSVPMPHVAECLLSCAFVLCCPVSGGDWRAQPVRSGFAPTATRGLVWHPVDLVQPDHASARVTIVKRPWEPSVSRIGTVTVPRTPRQSGPHGGRG